MMEKLRAIWSIIKGQTVMYGNIKITGADIIATSPICCYENQHGRVGFTDCRIIME